MVQPNYEIIPVNFLNNRTVLSFPYPGDKPDQSDKQQRLSRCNKNITGYGRKNANQTTKAENERTA